MPKDKYSEFHIPKKMGGKRTILAPVSSLKIIQAKLAQVLQAVYIPRATVHGFTLNRSILTNARLHANKRWVFNVDIEEFFPSINFGRVRGMFSSPPYSLPPNVATVLAQIACFSNQLPQGAPTSPIISNMICSKLDSQLRRLAIESRCVYTRYADDLTLSTTLRRFPGNLATLTDTGSVEAGPQLVQLIAQNGFTLNIAKARLQSQHQRQEVTGLTTNLFPNIQRRYLHQVRAMLHDWKRHGEVIAFQRHFALEPYRRREGTTATAFHSIVKGKIDFLGMIKGRNDPSYRKFLYEYAGLNPDFILPKEPLPPPPPDTRQAFVFTEGKTDWMHLEAALKRLHHHSKFKDVHLIFDKDTPQPGNKNLLAMCKTFARTPTPYPVPYIFLFDRDDPGILRDANLDKADIHEWGANVFSVAIPIPPTDPPSSPYASSSSTRTKTSSGPTSSTDVSSSQRSSTSRPAGMSTSS
jgi:RNA-directed DNA polymerase